MDFEDGHAVLALQGLREVAIEAGGDFVDCADVRLLFIRSSKPAKVSLATPIEDSKSVIGGVSRIARRKHQHLSGGSVIHRFGCYQGWPPCSGWNKYSSVRCSVFRFSVFRCSGVQV